MRARCEKRHRQQVRLQAEEWEVAKEEEMRQILVERARLRGMIPSSDLVAQIETIRMEPDSFALAHMLQEI